MNVSISYAHCVKWTTGQLDCAPYSQYELRDEVVDIKFLGAEDYVVEALSGAMSGQIIGEGETENEAIWAAGYHLMRRSREAAAGS